MKKRSEKGELMSQPILFVFALVVGAMILFFGIKAAFDVKKTAGLVEATSFISSLKSDVEQYYYLDTGSSKVVKLNLPENIKYVCFRYRNINEVPSNVDSKISTLMSINPNDNVFIYPLGEGKSSFKILNLVPYPRTPALCFKNKEEFKIVSMGDHVGVGQKNQNFAESTSGTSTSGTTTGGLLPGGVTLGPEDLNWLTAQ